MANRLKMAKIEAILSLHQRNWSIRRIAKELGLHRDTVARYVQLHEARVKPASAAEGAPRAKQATTTAGACGAKQATPEGAAVGSATAPGEKPQQASLCEPWRPIILAKLEAGLTAQRIYQDLVNEHGFAGKYHSVRRFVRRLGQGRALPFRRLECAPGLEAQVDFGTGPPRERPQGARLPQPRRSEPPFTHLGGHGRRPADPRHHPPAGRPAVCGGGTSGVAAVAAGAVPVLSRGATPGAPRWACRGR
jgi:transposase